MSLQYIIDRAQMIEQDRRRMIGQTLSRSQRIKTAERSTAQPYRFKITPPAQMHWAEARGVVEVIELQDRAEEYEVSLGNVPGMQYITEYQGDLSPNQLSKLTVHSTGTSTITLSNLPTVPYKTVLFKKGDFVQPANSRYPYTVTEDVVRGVNTTTTVTLNRPIITSEAVNLIGQTLKVGNQVTWRVVVTGLPTYTHIPGRRIQYNGDFEVIEKVI